MLNIRYNSFMKEIALIGTTATGKTALAIKIAQQTNSIILSLDSLCLYKEINIASAKPTNKEMQSIIHFGIDEIYPNEHFDVVKFLKIYEKTKQFALKNQKNIIIVGGTGFYLKALIDGISSGINTNLKNVKMDISYAKAYTLLHSLDKEYMNKIQKNDKYRINKAYSIYITSKLTPSKYFKLHPKKAIIKNLKIFEILIDKEELKTRIKLRTKQMLSDGLIDEVIFLENKYNRNVNCMSSIGIVESLEYLDGRITKDELENKISSNTLKLAKRQNTFNKSQITKNKISSPINTLSSDILKYFKI